MGLFGKNPNEAAYAGGQKHWTDVIKNTGDGNLLVWRQPEEDFNSNSTLVVMPGEEAIFVNQGESSFHISLYRCIYQGICMFQKWENLAIIFQKLDDWLF